MLRMRESQSFSEIRRSNDIPFFVTETKSSLVNGRLLIIWCENLSWKNCKIDTAFSFRSIVDAI